MDIVALRHVRDYGIAAMENKSEYITYTHCRQPEPPPDNSHLSR
jgi:hypothetical protein